MAETIRAVRVERNTESRCDTWTAGIHGDGVHITHQCEAASTSEWRSVGTPPPPDVAAELANLLAEEVRRAVMAACGIPR